MIGMLLCYSQVEDKKKESVPEVQTPSTKYCGK